MWGPELLETSVSAEELRSMLAVALDVSVLRVRLANGAELIDSCDGHQTSLKALGPLDDFSKAVCWIESVESFLDTSYSARLVCTCHK